MFTIFGGEGENRKGETPLSQRYEGFPCRGKGRIKDYEFCFRFRSTSIALNGSFILERKRKRWYHRKSNLMFTLSTDKDQILDSESFTWWLVMGASASVKARTWAQRLVP